MRVTFLTALSLIGLVFASAALIQPLVIDVSAAVLGALGR